MLISTFVFVKNSSLGCHITNVPVSLVSIFLTSLSLKTPSSNLIFSLSPSLYVVTSNQWLKKVVILEPIPKEPKEVPSYVPSSLYLPDVFNTLNAASRIVFPSSLNEFGINPWP